MIRVFKHAYIFIIFFSCSASSKRLTGVFNVPVTPNRYSNGTEVSLSPLEDGKCRFPVINNGKFTVKTQGYYPGQPIPNFATVRFECDEDYGLFPPEKLNTCNDGVWYRELPQCYIFSYCSSKRLTGRFNVPVTGRNSSLAAGIQLEDGECAPPVMTNGKFTVKSQGYVSGQAIPNFGTIRFECDEDYGLFPPGKLNTCNDGIWYRVIPQCYTKCPSVSSSTISLNCETNGTVHSCSQFALEGTIMTMSCQKHYTPVTSSPYSTSVCRNGFWDHSLITCVPDCGQQIPQGTPYVVKGVPVKLGAFPWHIGIYMYQGRAVPEYVCGGSIINDKVVLTAAHCLADSSNGKLYNISNFVIAAGKYYSAYDSVEDKIAQKRNIIKVEIPGGYKGILSNYASDLALVIVDKAFSFSSVVQPVCIDWENKFEDEQLVPDQFGKVVGWGYTEDTTDKPSHELKLLKVPFIDNDNCVNVVPQNFIKFVTPDKICAGYTNGSSVCQGDSGGSLVFERTENRKTKFYVRGLVSAGPLKEGNCDTEQYSVYTKISMYLPFIKRVEALNREVPTWGVSTRFSHTDDEKNGRKLFWS